MAARGRWMVAIMRTSFVRERGWQVYRFLFGRDGARHFGLYHGLGRGIGALRARGCWVPLVLQAVTWFASRCLWGPRGSLQVLARQEAF